MRAEPDCVVCAFRQALNTARQASGDPSVHRRVLQRLAATPETFHLAQTPARLSQPVYRIVAEEAGVADPYAEQKRRTNAEALQLAGELRATIEAAPDPLDAALHAAVAGNIIDLGIGHAFDLSRDIRAMMVRPFAISALETFRAELRSGCRLLYLGDNAGEIVFDGLLVERLLAAGVRVTFAVKSGPIINDATMEDARQVRLTDLVPVIETGAGDIGVEWANVSDEFRRAFETADVILSKGHGNFETTEDRPENLYFLLKAKCEIVARALGVTLGDIVFARGRDRLGV
jgi:uncharacterized protein with ATP-grasp and redox domains